MRFHRVLLVAPVAIVLISVRISDAEQVVGLTQDEPAGGRFVKTDQGYMIPYKMKIPGTEVEFEMVPIPSGKLVMGSPDSEKNRSPDEGPQFEVEVEPFWMGKHEVKWEEYRIFMNLYDIVKEFQSQQTRLVTDGNRIDAVTFPTPLYEPDITYEFGDEPKQPAVTMTQYAAKQYTKWLSGISGQQFRLPSEAEWEYACRAGTKTAYHFGDDPAKLGDYAWFYDNSGEQYHDVGGKKPNPWGLYDMHGNVAEWTLDQYFAEGYKKYAGKSMKSKDALAWPTKAYPRVVRGGSWDNDADRCRSAARLPSNDMEWKSEDPNVPLSPWWFTSDPTRGIGFRLIRPLTQLPKKEMERFWEADVEAIKLDVTDRLTEGRGALGLVDKDLPAAIEALKSGN